MRRPNRLSRRAARLLAQAVILMIATIPAAQAYIDPGTGSMILQLLGAGVAAALFYLRSWRTWLMGWLFGRRKIRSEAIDPDKGERS